MGKIAEIRQGMSDPFSTDPLESLAEHIRAGVAIAGHINAHLAHLGQNPFMMESPAIQSYFDFAAELESLMEGTIREYQRHTTQWGMGKNFDSTGSYGPWMVTADDLPRAGKGLKIESRLNGTTMQSSNTDHFMFPVAESLVYLTEGITLEPGDLVFTGTPSGVGHARKPDPVWMKAGDEIEVEIEGVGLLRNRVQDE